MFVIFGWLLDMIFGVSIINVEIYEEYVKDLVLFVVLGFNGMMEFNILFFGFFVVCMFWVFFYLVLKFLILL